MLIWYQGKGELWSWNSTILARGYSGKGEGRNNPDMQGIRAVGPIPRGFWRIGAPYASAKTGPLTIPLYKLDDNPGDDVDAITGRSAFRVHGDNARNDASEGCIILNRTARLAIANRTDEILWVIA